MGWCRRMVAIRGNHSFHGQDLVIHGMVLRFKIEMKQETKAKIIRRIKWFFGVVSISGLLAFSAWYYWQTQKELQAKDVALRSVKFDIKRDVENMRQKQHADFLKLLMEPLGWAIRTELLSGNIATIHQYLAQFVKNPTVELLAVVDADDKIISCTDKKIEGKNFSLTFADLQFETDAFQSTTKGEHHYVIQPVMGFDEKIGAIFLIYLSDDKNWLPGSLNNSSS